MTVLGALPRFTAMFTEAQVLYLQEVLGATVDLYRAPATVAVRTPPLGPSESALLDKILATIGIRRWIALAIGDDPPRSVTDVLDFSDGGPPQGSVGRVWQLPSLTSMTGQGPEVAAQKRRAWSILQQFSGSRG